MTKRDLYIFGAFWGCFVFLSWTCSFVWWSSCSLKRRRRRSNLLVLKQWMHCCRWVINKIKWLSLCSRCVKWQCALWSCAALKVSHTQLPAILIFMFSVNKGSFSPPLCWWHHWTDGMFEWLWSLSHTSSLKESWISHFHWNTRMRKEKQMCGVGGNMVEIN